MIKLAFSFLCLKMSLHCLKLRWRDPYCQTEDFPRPIRRRYFLWIIGLSYKYNQTTGPINDLEFPKGKFLPMLCIHRIVECDFKNISDSGNL